jgi:hypothetical protein
MTEPESALQALHWVHESALQALHWVHESALQALHWVHESALQALHWVQALHWAQGLDRPGARETRRPTQAVGRWLCALGGGGCS